jgi:Sec-independent protein translocase protein TatA
MTILSFIEGIIILVVVIAVSFIALSMQKRLHETMQTQQQAWERAQEMRQLQWRMQQEARITHLEQTLTALTQQWQQEQQPGTNEHVNGNAQVQEERANPVPDAEEVARTTRIAYEIARLPRVEDIPLPLNANDPNYKPYLH